MVDAGEGHVGHHRRQPNSKKRIPNCVNPPALQTRAAAVDARDSYLRHHHQQPDAGAAKHPERHCQRQPAAAADAAWTDHRAGQPGHFQGESSRYLFPLQVFPCICHFKLPGDSAKFSDACRLTTMPGSLAASMSGALSSNQRIVINLACPTSLGFCKVPRLQL